MEIAVELDLGPRSSASVLAKQEARRLTANLRRRLWERCFGSTGVTGLGALALGSSTARRARAHHHRLTRGAIRRKLNRQVA